MNILWLTPQLPCRIGGGQSHQWHLLRYLSERHRVTVAALASPLEQERVEEARDCCQELLAIPYRPLVVEGKWRNRWHSWRQLLFDPWPHYARTYPLDLLRPVVHHLLERNKYDIIHCEHLASAPLRGDLGHSPAILGCHNVEHHVARQILYAQRRVTRKIYCLIEWLKLYHFEEYWVRQFDGLTAVSKEDVSVFQKMAPRVSVHLVPNGVDVDYFASPSDGRRRSEVLFVGTLGYWPNADAVLFFCRDIWPLIRQDCPEATLSIVGANPPPDLLHLSRAPEITVTGYVPDVRPYFWRAALSVVPLRAGGGARNKILESLAAQCPVVSTTLGATGLDLGSAEGLLRADEPRAFAQQVVALLREPTRCEDLGNAGKLAVSQKYAWPSIVQRLEEAYARVLSRSKYLSRLGR